MYVCIYIYIYKDTRYPLWNCRSFNPHHLLLPARLLRLRCSHGIRGEREHLSWRRRSLPGDETRLAGKSPMNGLKNGNIIEQTDSRKAMWRKYHRCIAIQLEHHWPSGITRGERGEKPWDGTGLKIWDNQLGECWGIVVNILGCRDVDHRLGEMFPSFCQKLG